MKRPTTFGKYLLLERINVGGMAEVFIAKAFGVEGFERFLAIKKILPTMAEDQEFITMFIDEARISVQLNHANVVHIHELGKYDEAYFIAMEYVAGRDLRTILERYRRRKEIMPTAQAVFVASKMCEGLDYAHRKKDARGQELGIIHRDVSPQNILVSYEGEVKIIDFGIAKAANRSQKTQAGILKGKFGYMSPEQVRGMPIDRRSDIFAVGVILYEMLTGEKLFVGESDFSTLEKVRNAEVPLPRQFNPNVPSGLEKVVLKALTREPEDRYQWASDLQEDLMRFLLAGDAIYSGKHLASYMKEAFAEDMLREAEKMERYAGIEKPEQLESSGVTATPTPAPRPQRKASTITPVGPQPAPPVARSASSHSAPPPLVPPPTAEELAELDGAGDKTQLVDSASVLGGGASAPVLFDDSATGKNNNPLEDNTGRTEYPPDEDSATLDGNSNPFISSEATMAAPLPTGTSAALRKGKTPPPKAQVVIGEGEQENYAGATQIGPPPSSRGRDEEEDDSTKDVRGNSSRVGNKVRAQKPARDEEPAPEDETDETSEEDESQKTGKAAMPARKPTGTAVKAAKDKKPVASGPRKPINPKIFVFAGAGVLLLGIVATVIALFSGGDTGSILFTVEPASTSAVIRVDNQPVSPNTVIELEPGPHKVMAAADGFEVLETTVTITAGQKPQPMPLKLKRSGGSEPPPDKAPDETPKPPDKPVTATKPPDSEPVAKNPDAPKEPVPPKPTPPEPPKTFVAVFVGEDGADIKVDGKSAGKTPNAKLPNLSIGKTYKFVASRAGYKPYSGEFKSEGDSELTVEFALEKEEPKPVAETPKPPKPVEPPKPQPPKPTPSKVMGKLAASTKPAGAQIWVDGKYTGRDTPVAIGNPLLLPVGARKVVFKLGNKSTKPQMVTITEADVAKLIGVPIE
jgi:serine/threonine protein kinase